MGWFFKGLFYNLILTVLNLKNKEKEKKKASQNEKLWKSMSGKTSALSTRLAEKPDEGLIVFSRNLRGLRKLNYFHPCSPPPFL